MSPSPLFSRHHGREDGPGERAAIQEEYVSWAHAPCALFTLGACRWGSCGPVRTSQALPCPGPNSRPTLQAHSTRRSPGRWAVSTLSGVQEELCRPIQPGTPGLWTALDLHGQGCPLTPACHLVSLSTGCTEGTVPTIITNKPTTPQETDAQYSFCLKTVVSWMVAPKTYVLRNLWMWPYLEEGSLRIQLS